MTRVKYKRNLTVPRQLTPLQKIIVAKEIRAMKPMKQIAVDWKISRSYVSRIMTAHLMVRYDWRPEMEPK